MRATNLLFSVAAAVVVFALLRSPSVDLGWFGAGIPPLHRRKP